jgi:hypothetical protein
MIENQWLRTPAEPAQQHKKGKELKDNREQNQAEREAQIPNPGHQLFKLKSRQKIEEKRAKTLECRAEHNTGSYGKNRPVSGT